MNVHTQTISCIKTSHVRDANMPWHLAQLGHWRTPQVLGQGTVVSSYTPQVRIARMIPPNLGPSLQPGGFEHGPLSVYHLYRRAKRSLYPHKVNLCIVEMTTYRWHHIASTRVYTLSSSRLRLLMGIPTSLYSFKGQKLGQKHCMQHMKHPISNQGNIEATTDTAAGEIKERKVTPTLFVVFQDLQHSLAEAFHRVEDGDSETCFVSTNNVTV